MESEELKEHLLASVSEADSQDLVEIVRLLMETPEDLQHIGHLVLK